MKIRIEDHILESNPLFISNKVFNTKYKKSLNYIHTFNSNDFYIRRRNI